MKRVGGNGETPLTPSALRYASWDPKGSCLSSLTCFFPTADAVTVPNLPAVDVLPSEGYRLLWSDGAGITRHGRQGEVRIGNMSRSSTVPYATVCRPNVNTAYQRAGLANITTSFNRQFQAFFHKLPRTCVTPGIRFGMFLIRRQHTYLQLPGGRTRRDFMCTRRSFPRNSLSQGIKKDCLRPGV